MSSCSQQTSQRPGRRVLRRLLVVALAIVCCYVALYFSLTRLSMSIHRRYRAVGFYYVPVAPETLARSRLLGTLHQLLSELFYPIWYLDDALFGVGRWGSAPSLEMDWTLWEKQQEDAKRRSLGNPGERGDAEGARPGD